MSRRDPLTTLLAGAATAIALVAIVTDDVSSRPSHILLAPLDDNHPAAAPDNLHLVDANDNPQHNPYVPTKSSYEVAETEHDARSWTARSADDCLNGALTGTGLVPC